MSDENGIDREHVTPGEVTIAKTRKGYGYGPDEGPRDKFNYFIDDHEGHGADGMIYMYINTGRAPQKALFMDPRDAEIMGLQLIYMARKTMKEKGECDEAE